VGQGVSAIEDPLNHVEYLRLCVLLSGLVGLLQMLCGLLKLGVFVNRLPESAVSGFMTAAALTITVSQLKDALGLEVPRGLGFFELVFHLVGELGMVGWLPLLFSFTTITSLLVSFFCLL